MARKVKHILPPDFKQDGEYVDHKYSGCFLAPRKGGVWVFKSMRSTIDAEFDKLNEGMQFIREVTGHG